MKNKVINFAFYIVVVILIFNIYILHLYVPFHT